MLYQLSYTRKLGAHCSTTSRSLATTCTYGGLRCSGAGWLPGLVVAVNRTVPHALMRQPLGILLGVLLGGESAGVSSAGPRRCFPFVEFDRGWLLDRLDHVGQRRHGAAISL